MPIIIMSKPASKLEPSLKKKAYAFLEKLGEDDASSGLHIEPIAQSADDKVRTGRVDQFYRAVLFRVPSTGEPTYVFYGIWPHDDAIAVGRKTPAHHEPGQRRHRDHHRRGDAGERIAGCPGLCGSGGACSARFRGARPRAVACQPAHQLLPRVAARISRSATSLVRAARCRLHPWGARTQVRGTAKL